MVTVAPAAQKMHCTAYAGVFPNSWTLCQLFILTKLHLDERVDIKQEHGQTENKNIGVLKCVSLWYDFANCIQALPASLVLL